MPLDDRKCLQGILFVLYTGIAWGHLPVELGFGSGITCWRRFRRWCEAGVWDRLHRHLLAELHARRYRLVSSLPRQQSRESQTRRHRNRTLTGRPRPTRLETPHRVRRHWHPPRHSHHRREHPDISAARDLVEAIGPVAGRVGRPRRRPDAILTDGGYDSAAFRDWLHSRRIEPIIPKRNGKRIIGLGRIRWVVEQIIAHFHQFKRLAVRWDRHLLIHHGFTKLAAALICWRRLTQIT